MLGPLLGLNDSPCFEAITCNESFSTYWVLLPRQSTVGIEGIGGDTNLGVEATFLVQEAGTSRHFRRFLHVRVATAPSSPMCDSITTWAEPRGSLSGPENVESWNSALQQSPSGAASLVPILGISSLDLRRSRGPSVQG